MAKWERGGAINDVDMALSMIARGDPIYENHKVQTAGWTQSWTIRHVMNAVMRRHLFSPYQQTGTRRNERCYEN